MGEGRWRRKIRLIECNAKCRNLKKRPVKGLCGRCLPISVYNILIHTGKGKMGRVKPEKRLARLGLKYQHD